MDFLYSDMSSDESRESGGAVGEVHARQKGDKLILRVGQTARYVYAVRPGEQERVLKGPFPKNTDITVPIADFPPGDYTLYAGDIDEEIFAYGSVTLA